MKRIRIINSGVSCTKPRVKDNNIHGVEFFLSFVPVDVQRTAGERSYLSKD